MTEIRSFMMFHGRFRYYIDTLKIGESISKPFFFVISIWTCRKRLRVLPDREKTLLGWYSISSIYRIWSSWFFKIISTLPTVIYLSVFYVISVVSSLANLAIYIYNIHIHTHTYIYIHTYTNHSRSKSSPSQNVQTVQNPFQWGFLTCPYSNSPNVPFTSVRSRPIWPRCHWWQGCHTHRRARYGVGGYSLVTQVQWNGSNKDQLLEYNWNNGIIVLGINYYWSGISYNGIIIANSKDYSSNMS